MRPIVSDMVALSSVKFGKPVPEFPLPDLLIAIATFLLHLYTEEQPVDSTPSTLSKSDLYSTIDIKSNRYVENLEHAFVPYCFTLRPCLTHSYTDRNAHRVKGTERSHLRGARCTSWLRGCTRGFPRSHTEGALLRSS